MNSIKIHPLDNVAVALADIESGDCINADENKLCASEKISRGHKIALTNIKENSPVIKYGNQIGIATCDISAGSHVHTHNVKTALSEENPLWDIEDPKAKSVSEMRYGSFRLWDVSTQLWRSWQRTIRIWSAEISRDYMPLLIPMDAHRWERIMLLQKRF